jgi:uncharacterized protein YcsI (UPF0317 family)
MSTTFASPRELRMAAREGRFDRPTPGLCPGHVQANMAILPRDLAVDFRTFCEKNPKPCPLLEVIEHGAEPVHLAPGADVRTDLPRYRVWRRGEFEEATDVRDVWRDDLVTFLIGCSFTFEGGLMDAGIRLRHVELGTNCAMFVTNIACTSAGPFRGNMVVSMRPIPDALVETAYSITGRYPAVHGAPIHAGDPAAIGVADILRPDFGDAVEVKAGETPVFWACGVTPQVALMNAKPDLAITHAPGHMFVSDRLDAEYEVAG